MTTITIDNIDKMGTQDVLGLGKCLCAVGSLPPEFSDKPEYVGYNILSGYSYVTLENGLSILSFMGSDVEYMAYLEDEEVFFETIQEYKDYIQTK